MRNEPEVKEKLFAVLKQFAAERKVDWLASVLPDILTTEEQQQLISNIRYHENPICHLQHSLIFNLHRRATLTQMFSATVFSRAEQFEGHQRASV